MLLTVFLIVCGYCVTLSISAGTVIREESRFHHLVLFFHSIRIPLAAVSALVAIIAAVMIFGSDDYALLTWMIVLVNSFIAVVDVLIERFAVAEGSFRNVLEFLAAKRGVFAVAGLVILTLKTVYLLAPVLRLVL